MADYLLIIATFAFSYPLVLSDTSNICICAFTVVAPGVRFPHIAELPDYLGITEIAGSRITSAAGPDSFVVPLNPSDPDVRFLAWTYAKGRCKELVSVHN